VATLVKVHGPLDNYTSDGKTSEVTLVYKVEYTDATATALEASLANDGTTAIPAKRGPVTGYTGVTVRNKSADRDEENPNWFVVTIKADNSRGDEEKPAGTGVRWNKDIQIGGIGYTEPVYKTRTGAKVANAAGQTFDPQPTKTYYDEEIRVSYDTDLVDHDGIKPLRGKINEGTVSVTVNGHTFSWDTLTLMLTDAQVSSVFQDGAFYWHVEIVMQFRRDGWIRKILNQGMMQLHTNGVDLEHIKDKYGVEVTEQVPLDAGGRKLAVGGTPVYLEFDVEDLASFNPLFVGF
jgi:hypothetical protein